MLCIEYILVQDSRRDTEQQTKAADRVNTYTRDDAPVKSTIFEQPTTQIIPMLDKWK